MKTRSLLIIALGLLPAGESCGQSESLSALPLVRSGAVLGDDLLERLASAAKAAGYRVEVADIRAQTDGIQLLLPGLVLTPPDDHHQKTISLPVLISIGRGEHLAISFRAITRPGDPLPEASTIRIVLRQIRDDRVLAEQTTKLVRGWNTPALSWLADRDRVAGECVVDIIPAFAGPIKITLPQGLLLPAVTK